MAKVILNAWEDGGNEGVFDSEAEAKEYVLENDMDVVIHSERGSYRFNTDIDAKKKGKK